MKIIVIENLYPKIGIVNGTIGYVQNISIKKIDWTHYDELMPPLRTFWSILMRS
jgi:hypothetical protein